jgi:DnaJ-class molecular chaperone
MTLLGMLVQNFDEHFKVLGLEKSTATRASVAAAYRLKAREHHPDHGGSAEEFDKATKARDACIDYIDFPPPAEPCMVCGGSGRVGRGHGWTQVTWMCNNCLGSGKL